MVATYYLDTSAAVKFLAHESHSLPFADFYRDHVHDTWVSSALLRVELMRAVTRSLPAAGRQARAFLRSLKYLSIDDKVIDAASAEPDPHLRSVDAIHLSSARKLGTSLDAILTYDDRLAVAATNAGMAVISPRD